MHLSPENIIYLHKALRHWGFANNVPLTGSITRELIKEHEGFCLKHEYLAGKTVLFPSSVTQFTPTLIATVKEIGGPAEDLPKIGVKVHRTLSGRGVAVRRQGAAFATVEGKASLKTKVLAAQHPQYEAAPGGSMKPQDLPFDIQQHLAITPMMNLSGKDAKEAEALAMTVVSAEDALEKALEMVAAEDSISPEQKGGDKPKMPKKAKGKRVS